MNLFAPDPTAHQETDPVGGLPLAFTAFYTTAQHAYLRWAQLVLGNHRDAELAVQNAGARMLRKWDTLLVHAEYEALAFKIVYDCVSDFRPTPPRLAVGQRTQHTDPELLVRTLENLAQAQPLQADCVRLHIGRLTPAAIGQTLGITETSAHLLLERGRATGQRLLDDYPADHRRLPTFEDVMAAAARDLDILFANHDAHAFNHRLAERLLAEKQLASSSPISTQVQT